MTVTETETETVTKTKTLSEAVIRHRARIGQNATSEFGSQ